MHLHTTQSHQDRNMEEEHYGTTCMQFTSSHHSKAAAPDMISINSLVITACRVRLKVRVSLSIISPTKPQTITYKQLRVTNQRNRKKQRTIDIQTKTQSCVNTVNCFSGLPLQNQISSNVWWIVLFHLLHAVIDDWWYVKPEGRNVQ